MNKMNSTKFISVAIIVFFSLNTLFAQEIGENQSAEKNSKTIIEVSTADGTEEVAAAKADTTKIRMGRREIVIIESGDNKDVNIKKIDKSEWGKSDDNKCRPHKFDGHWDGFDIGINGLTDENYDRYNGLEFMELRQNKSTEVNFNFGEWNLGLLQSQKYVGLVSGMGLSYNNYRFENPYTIQKVNGIIEPLALDPNDYEKSKLTVVYLTVPLMLEIQNSENDHFLSVGVVGGLNIGSHTKVKWDNRKEKERGGFSINPFKCAAICRVGIKDFCVYATYNLTPLFEENRGPDLTPFSIGISFM